jgi:hypothetical protein
VLSRAREQSRPLPDDEPVPLARTAPKATLTKTNGENERASSNVPSCRTDLLRGPSLAGKVVATQNLDTGAVGALFGIVATGTDASSAKIYFNDDNDNTVMVLDQ